MNEIDFPSNKSEKRPLHKSNMEIKDVVEREKVPICLYNCINNSRKKGTEKCKKGKPVKTPEQERSTSSAVEYHIKEKKRWTNFSTKPTVYEPKSDVLQFQNVCCINEQPELESNDYMKFLTEIIDSFKIKAISCQKNGLVYRIKIPENKRLRHFFKRKSQNFSFDGNSLPSNGFVSTEEEYKKLSASRAVKNGTLKKEKLTEFKNNRDLNLQSTVASGSKKKKERTRNKKNSAKNASSEKNHFPDYWSASEVQKGLQDGELLKGVLRINPKNYREAYVSNKDRKKQDYVIESLLDRNRALEGDVVVLKLKLQSEWKGKQQTAVVVYIHEIVHPRKAVGHLKLSPDRNKRFALFYPRDNRIPRIRIPSTDWPPLFARDPQRYEDTLFLAKITEWREVNFADGTLVENIGTSFEIKSETKALLLENELDISPFPPNTLNQIPKLGDINEDEFKYRLDLRQECIFTIDPLTARDLDDAVSCKVLCNGNLQVGVHISDVSYYLEENTSLDEIVSKKATTIYLVDNVYHMLPTDMCLHCSLLPGNDKLAFSVIWEMTPEGEILNTQFRRALINSCAQLAYEHVQEMIENPDKIFEDKLPHIHNGFNSKDIQEVVQKLYKISVNLRNRRFENGALSINQPKLVFRLDPDTCLPTDWFVYENKEAHRLIEEFMLLANISVAQKIREDFPDLAFLRCHDPPAQHMLYDVQKTMEAAGIHLDISSSAGIHSSLRKYSSSDFFGAARLTVLNCLLAKPMTRARYLCAADCQDDMEFYHYALSVPLYTHFTSPIRRYADIMVHRLLSASLGYCERPSWEAEAVIQIAANCNKQKYNAKRAGEASSDLFFACFVETHQPFIQDAVVCDVKDRSFDVIVILTGTNVRVYADKFEKEVKWSFVEEDSRKRITIEFPETQEEAAVTSIIELFSIVKVALQRKAKTNKLEATMLRPINKLVVDRSY